MARAAGAARGSQRRRKLCLLSGALALLFLPALAPTQTISPQELNFYTEPYTPVPAGSVRRNVRLVEVDAVVRNAKGDAVAGLRQPDFKIYDNGKEQAITQFIVENATPKAAVAQASPTSSATAKAYAAAPNALALTALPRYIALFFDDRSTSFADLRYAQTAAEKFVREDLRAGDRVGVFTASERHTLDFTSDKQKLIQAIEAIRAEVLQTPPSMLLCSPKSPSIPQYPMGPYAAYLIVDLHDQQTLSLYSCGSVNQGPAGGSALPTRGRGGRGGNVSSPERKSFLGPIAGAAAATSAPATQSQAALEAQNVSPSSRNTGPPGSTAGAASAPAPQNQAEFEARNILDASELTTKFILGSLEAVIGRLSQMPGQRIAVLTSSGFFSASLNSEVDRVVGDALRADVVINTLDAKGLVAPTAGSGLKTANPHAMPIGPNSQFEEQLQDRQRNELQHGMASLALGTGGRFFENDNDLAAGFKLVAAVADVSYRLGFSPSNLKDDGSFHALKLKVAGPGSLRVQARRGYYTPSRAVGQAEARADRFNQEVLKADEIDGLRAEVSAQPGRLASGETALAVSARLDPRELSFQKSNGRHRGEFSLIAALFTPSQEFIVGEMGLVQMDLENKTLADLTRRGLDATLVLNAPSGGYRLRVVIEDAGDGKMFATTRPASIP